MTFARRSEETLGIQDRNCSQLIRHQYSAWFSLDSRYQSCGEPQNHGSRSHLSIRVCRSSRSRLLTSNFIPCEAATSTLKSGHLLARLRERCFLLILLVARPPTFSTWLASWRS